MPREVFVSYAHSDSVAVKSLIDALRAEGVHVWWDPRIEAGENWRRELVERLQSVDSVVVAWSPNSVRSEFVVAEAIIAVSRSLMIPVRVARCTPPKPLDAIQCIDLFDWNGDRGDPAFKVLLDAIRGNFEELDALDAFEKKEGDVGRVYEGADMSAIMIAAAAGDSAAQHLLGHALAVGAAGLKKDTAEAITWLTRAANGGVVAAMSTLGTLHSLAAQTPDWPEALKWYVRAAEAGDASSAYEAGEIYGNGYGGVRKNLALARKYFECAVKLGHKDASFALKGLSK